MVRSAWKSYVEPGCRQFVSLDAAGSRARVDLIVENDDLFGRRRSVLLSLDAVTVAEDLREGPRAAGDRSQ